MSTPCSQSTASSGASPGDFIDQASQIVSQMMRARKPDAEILACLVAAGETAAGPGAVVSILVLDEEGLLRNGSSPGLPDDYLSAIDGLRPDPCVGTCAAAAATGVVVVTPDFFADDKWAELRHLPLSLGFVAGWSMPIKSDTGSVLGTFGTYFRERRSPTDAERRAVEQLATAAAIVLTRPKRRRSRS